VLDCIWIKNEKPSVYACHNQLPFIDAKLKEIRKIAQAVQTES
jgi:hypothetical protein